MLALTNWRFWLGAAFSVLFLVLFLYRVDLGELVQSVRDVRSAYVLLVPAVIIYFIAVVFRTLRWRILLSPLGDPGTGRLFPVVVVGYMANNLLPIRLGELARAYYLRHKTGMSSTSGLATIAVERVSDGLVLLFLAAVLALFLPTLGLLQALGDSAGLSWVVIAAAFSVPFLVAIAVLMVLAMNPRWLQRVALVALAAAPPRWRRRLARLGGLFVQGLASLRSPRQVALVLVLSLVVWGLEASMYGVIGVAFNLHEVFGSAMQFVAVMLLATAISNLSTALPSSQGGVGPFEFFTKQTVVLFGVGPDLASAYALVLHATLLAPVTLLGLLFLWRDNLSLRRLVPREAEQVPGRPGGNLVTKGEEHP